MSDQATTQEAAETTENATPEMWVPDEPTPTEAMTRPEATEEETPDAEEQVEVEAEVETEQEAAKPEQPKGQNRDAAIIKLQQRQTTFERTLTSQLADVTGRIDKVLEAVANRGGEATPKQEQQIQAAKDDLTDLFERTKSADILDGETFVQVMQAVMAKQGGAVDPAVKKQLDAIQQKLDATERMTAQQAAQQKANQSWESLKKQLTGIDADALKLKAWEGIDERYPKLDEESKTAIARERFDVMLEAEKAKVKPTSPVTKIDPVRTTPDKSTKGTQTVSTGASTGRSAAPAIKPKPPLWEPD